MVRPFGVLCALPVATLGPSILSQGFVVRNISNNDSNAQSGHGGHVRKIPHLPVIRLCPTLFLNPEGRRCLLEPQESFDTAQM